MYHEHQFECLELDREAKDELIRRFEDAPVEDALEAVKRGWENPELPED